MTREQERSEFNKTIWNIANDLRGLSMVGILMRHKYEQIC